MTCCECRNGEHPNYDENIELVYVKDPDTSKLVKRGWMCAEHRQAYLDDGYTVAKC